MNIERENLFMKKYWSTLVWSIISAVIMLIITSAFLDFLVKAARGTESATTMELFRGIYMDITYGFCALNILFGLWGVFKKAGCTALKVYALFLIIFGGIVLYVIPAIIDLVVASKTKNKMVKAQIEKEALEKLGAEQNQVQAE